MHRYLEKIKEYLIKTKNKLWSNQNKYLLLIGIIVLSWVIFGTIKLIRYQNWKNMIPSVIGANFDLNYKKIPYNVKNIDIIFSTNLNKDTIKNNFQIYPNIPWNVSIVSGNIIRYKLDENLKIWTDYTLLIGKDIKAENWKILAKEQTYMIQAVAWVKATQIFPQWELENLSQNIIAFFNIPLVPLTTLDQKDKIPCPLEISPSIEWKCKWTTSSVVEFIPKNHLDWATKYTVKIKNVDWLFYPIEEEKQIEFTTPKLKAYIPETFSPKDWLIITFNFPIKNENLTNNIKLYNHSTWTQNLSWNNQIDIEISQDPTNPSSYIIKPKANKFTYSKSYNLIISKWISPLNWNIPLQDEYNRIINATNFITSIDTYQRIYSQTGALVDTKFFSYSTGIDSDYYYKYLPNDTLFQINLEEEINLDKNLFELSEWTWKNLDFEISYVKEEEISYDNGKEITNTIERKNKIKLELKNKFENNKTISLKLKKSSNDALESDVIKTYNTSPKLALSEFKFISYNKTCLYFNNPIRNEDKLNYLDKKATNYKKITTQPESRIASFDMELTRQSNFIEKINDIKQDKTWDNLDKNQQKKLDDLFLSNWQCPLFLKDTDYTFALNTRLNPNSTYKINISKDLEDKYGNKLEQDISKEVKTSQIKDIDKYLYSSLNKTYNVIPSNLPITLNLQSINLDSAYVQVCQMDEENYKDYLEKTYYNYNTNYEPKCNKTIVKKVNLSNKLWNLSNNRFDVEKDILWEKLSYNIVLVRWSVSNNFDPYLASNIKWYDWTDYYSIFYKNSTYNKEFINLYIRSNLFVWVEKAQNKNLIFATDYEWKNNIQWLSFDFYKYDQNSLKISKTDTKVEFNQKTWVYEIKWNLDANLIFAKNKDSRWTILLDKDALANYDFWYIAWIGSSEKDFLYLYSERPLYKPWDTVYFKGLLRQFTLDWFHKSDIKEWTLEILDENYSTIYTTKIKLDNNSNFNWEFSIPKQTPVWTYRFKFTNTNQEEVMNTASFSIEEYVKPVFKVNVTSEKNEFSIWETSKILVQPEYYFWWKMINTHWNYSILTQNYYFDAKDYSDYQFGNWYEYFNCLYWDNCTYNDSMLAYTGFNINKDWEYFMNYKFSDTTWEKIYTFNYEITDPDTQKTSSKDLQTIVHNTDWYVWIKNNYWNTKDKWIKLEWVVLDWKVQPKSWSKILLQLIKQDWQSIKKQDVDGIFYNDYSLKESVESEKTIYAWNNWLFDETIFPKSNWEYKLLAVYTWANWHSFKSSTTAYVGWDWEMLWNNWNNDITKLISDKQILNIWDTQEYILQSPVKSWKTLIMIEKDDWILDYFIHDIKSYWDKISIPVKETYYPNFYVKALLIWKNNNDQLPTYKRALNITKVATDYKNLNIEIKTDKQNYLPWDEINLEINVKDKQWKPVVWANWSLSIVDESLLALKWNPKQNPYAYFYDIKRYLWTLTYSSLKDLIERLEVKDMSHGEKWWDWDNLKGWNSKKKRWTFKDTAYWLANFITDANWQAKLKTDKLPDNLTTWVIETLINTPNDNKIWVNRAYIITNKKVMINENTPSFFGSSDEITLAPVLFNKTGKDQSFDITISATNANVINGKETVYLKNNEQKTIKFKIKLNNIDKNPQQEDFSKINIKAIASETSDQDEIEKLIQIKPTTTSESISTIWKTDLASYEEKIDLSWLPNTSGLLKINYSATLLTALLDGIDYMQNYPYGCSEQITSTIIPNILIKNLYDATWIEFDLNKKTIKYWDENWEWYKTKTLSEIIKAYLVDINEFQNPDWGYTYWTTKDTIWENISDFGLSSYIVDSIASIKKTWFDIDQTKLDKAVKYLKDSFYKNKIQWCSLNDCTYSTTDRLNALLAIINYDSTDYEVYKMWKLIDDNSNVNSIRLSKAKLLAKLLNVKWITTEEKTKLKQQSIDIVNKILTEELVFNPKWSYIGKDDYYSRITNTSKLLEIISILWKENFKDSDQIIENIIRWTISQKKDWSFWSTQDTISVIRAITQYIRNTWDLKDLDMNAKLSINWKQIEERNFDKKNQFEVFSKIVDMWTLIANNSFQVFKNWKWTLYYDLTLKYFLPSKDTKQRDEGIAVIKDYYDYNEYNKIKKLKQQEWDEYNQWKINYDKLKYPKDIVEYINPIKEWKIWQLVVVYNKIITAETRDKVALEWFIPSWSQLVNINLKTESQQAKELINDQTNIFSKTEYRLDRFFWYADVIYPWIYEYNYVIRLTHAWTFNIKPTKIFEFYNDEVFWRTNWETFIIE